MAPKVEHKRRNSKHKIDRRMGVNIWGRTKSPLNARSYALVSTVREEKSQLIMAPS